MVCNDPTKPNPVIRGGFEEMIIDKSEGAYVSPSYTAFNVDEEIIYLGKPDPTMLRLPIGRTDAN